MIKTRRKTRRGEERRGRQGLALKQCRCLEVCWVCLVVGESCVIQGGRGVADGERIGMLRSDVGARLVAS